MSMFNVSLGRDSPRTEIKNLLSVRAVREATRFKIEEDVGIFEKQVLIQASMKVWDGIAVWFLRAKEGEKDYWYCPTLSIYAFCWTDKRYVVIRTSKPSLSKKKHMNSYVGALLRSPTQGLSRAPGVIATIVHKAINEAILREGAG
jgi:Asp-tRNA(Asn)/Glu-tRNA(Gln) amidotransferase B subunit